MELIYLWVEDYKNIKEQGFNFSPRFDCNFDGKNLTIKPEKHTSVFPENINVTAIVGENGSGKSSICNIIDLIKLKRVKFIYKLKNTLFTNLNISTKNRKKYNLSAICHDNEDFLEYKMNSEPLNCNDDHPENCKLMTIAEVLEQDHNCFNFIKKEFIFTKWNIKFSTHINTQLNSGIKKLDEKYQFPYSMLSEQEKNKTPYLYFFTFVLIKYIENILKKIKIENSKYLDHINILANDFTKDNYLNLANSIDLYEFESIGNYKIILKTLQNFDKSVTQIKELSNSKNINSNDIQNFTNSGIYLTFHNYCKNYFKQTIIEIDYLTNKNLKYSELSDGEQQRILYNALLAKELIAYNDEDVEHHICTLDESDLFLHPNWQRLILNDLLYLCKRYKEKDFFSSIHLVLTTHSPFILSDLPKENVIFLKNGKQEKAFEHKQTFGANIHTLLSDGFFMNDGLMGEFAKGKIEEIKKFYEVIKKLEERILLKDNIKKLAKKSFEKRKRRFEHIQSIIGEPFLQTVIKNYLDEIELLLSDDNTLIDNEINQLEAKIEKLKSLKNG